MNCGYTSGCAQRQPKLVSGDGMYWMQRLPSVIRHECIVPSGRRAGLFFMLEQLRRFSCGAAMVLVQV